MRILAVDPGLMTGFATYTRVNRHTGLVFDEYEKWDFLDWVQPEMDYYEGNLPYYDAIVCEKYTITQQTLKMSRQPHSLEIIGVLKWWCHEREIPFIEQTPAEAKSFITDDRLKSLGYYTPGKGHANDAARHLALYLLKEDILSIEDML